MAPTTTRELSGEKAQRILEAMRASVGLRGAAASTFDHVAREAGVSRGLLHYYFGTKERLLVEVVRRDCDVRMGVLDAAFEAARGPDDLIDALVRSLEDIVDHDPGFIALIFEMFTAGRLNEEIAGEVAEVIGRTRRHMAELLASKRDAGAVALAAEPDALANLLLSLADGLALRMLAEPDHDHGPTIEAGVRAVRALITGPAV